MNDQTFHSRLVELLKKSRKATRLYSGVSKSKRGTAYAESQVTEWKNVNHQLVTSLSAALDQPNANKTNKLANEVALILDRFLKEEQSSELELKQKQKKLIQSAENSSFVQAATLSQELVTLKARVQALQAVHHELKSVIRKSRVTLEPIAHTPKTTEPEQKVFAQVIPMRKKVQVS
ncbi:MAG: hypothetical protein H6619_06405 [Deltaproteobacteria bacterium]|nr:hypothetical protein [Deltaproteobacteria bacterium]